jgi:hypothetical protein
VGHGPHARRSSRLRRGGGGRRHHGRSLAPRSSARSCGSFAVASASPTIGAINRGGSYDGLSQSAHGTLAASLPEARQVATTQRRRRSGISVLWSGDAARRHCSQTAMLETDGWPG